MGYPACYFHAYLAEVSGMSLKESVSELIQLKYSQTDTIYPNHLIMYHKGFKCEIRRLYMTDHLNAWV